MNNEHFKQSLLLAAAAVLCLALSACATTSGSVAPPQGAGPYHVLVIPDATYPWAAPQIGSSLADDVTYFKGSFLQAIEKAKNSEVNGILAISLDTSSVFESGQVNCYSPSGKSLWHQKVSFNMGGSETEIAHKFTNKLAKELSGKHCGVPRT